jgi:uncharacterized membrane protein (DUF2068 family)
MPDAAPHRHRSAPLLLIGAFKLFKATLLLLIGLSAIRLLHRDVAEQLTDWFSDFRIDPHNRYLYAAIQKLGMLDDHKLKEIGFGSFFYASLLTIEGVGLCLRKRWAEFFTVGMTMSLVPLEVFEIYQRATMVRMGLLLVNLAIVWYLIRVLRRDRRAELEGEPDASSPQSATGRMDSSAPAVRVAENVRPSGIGKPPKSPGTQSSGPRGQSSSHTVR